MNGDQSSSKQQRDRGGLLILLIVLAGALAALCHEGFLPHRVMWANDVSLGEMLDPSNQLPDTFTGRWGSLEWVGGIVQNSPPTLTSLLQMVLPPAIYLKIYAPLTMLALGLGAGLFFKQLGFAAPVCVIGGLGAGLNMHFFSNACWGLGNWGMSAAMVFVALTVLVSPSLRPLWVKAALAGICVGLVVMEGFDVGAILSIYVGIFVLFFFARKSATLLQGLPTAIGVDLVVVLFALLISASTLSTFYTLVLTPDKAKSTPAAEQTAAEKKEHWNFLTQWSFPKVETLRLVIPGLFGYRLQDYITDTNKASAYWGSIAEDPRVDELQSSNPEVRSAAAASFGVGPDIQTAMAGDNLAAREQIVDQLKGYMQRRHTGSGDYTGVLVCLLAVFALFNSWRKVNGPYSQHEQQLVWFWGLIALISLLAAWGRYTGFYGFLYALVSHVPFINNIRNAIKFLHPLNVCLIVLSGYGLEALYRGYMRGAANRPATLSQRLKNWWRGGPAFDKKWTIGTLLVVLASLVGLLLFTSSKADVIHYLEHNGFPEDMAPQMAAFSIHEVVFFIGFFAASVAVVIAVLSGLCNGGRAKWAWLLLGGIMIFDLGRADAPWIRYFDYTYKYSMSPVVDFLRHDPWEHRVMSRFSPTGGYIPSDGNLPALCHWWLENDYLANNIESLEIDQAPRLPDPDRIYIGNFGNLSPTDLSAPVRMWRLTNTRYILADSRVTPALNQLAEPRNSFRNIMLGDIVPKRENMPIEDAGDLTIQTNDNGHVVLIEFTAALPRAKLYANWQMTDDATTLAELNSSKFDPAKTVLIANDTPVPEKPGQPDADPGTVTIANYQPKYVQLKADAKTPAVLLLNDRIEKYWKVRVDQKPAGLLRCNYIMRGVFLPAGAHTVEFRFQEPLQWLYVSLTGFAIGVGLVGYVLVTRSKRSPETGSEKS
jgi:hypothetical protein